jgi:hypothetical protein
VILFLVTNFSHRSESIKKDCLSLFLLKEKVTKKLFADFLLFLMVLMRSLRLVQGQPDRSAVCPANALDRSAE